MRFASKYAGKCKFCEKPYQIGDLIDWEQDKGAAHAGCTDAMMAVPIQPGDPFYVEPETIERLFAMNRENAALMAFEREADGES
jgi:hypothetical protein